MSAAELLDALTAAGCGPAVVDRELEYDDPPAPLAPVALVLHTGVRALLTGRTWFGCDTDTGRVFALNPRELIPRNAGLLCVEGDDTWDRVHPVASLDLPQLFAPHRRVAPRGRRVYS